MGSIFDSIFKSKETYLRKEIDKKNNSNLPSMPKLILDDFCKKYYVQMHNTIISGGFIENRATIEYSIIRQAQEMKLPVIIIHSGNRYMKSGVAVSTKSENIGYYDPLTGKTPHEIADILTDVGSNILQTQSDLFGFWVLVAEILTVQGKPVTLERLVAFRCDRIVETLASLVETNVISNCERIDFTNRYGTVASCMHNAQRLLIKLKSDATYSTSAVVHSLDDVLDSGGIASIDIISDTNDILKELCFTDFDRIMKLGRPFLLIVEGLSFLKKESHVDNVLLRNSGGMSLLFAADDVPAMTQENNENFQTLVSGHANIMILKHNSAESAKKWSDYLGQHYVKQVDYNTSVSKENLSLIRSNKSTGIAIRQERRDIVPSEWITRLEGGQSFVLDATARQILKVEIK